MHSNLSLPRIMHLFLPLLSYISRKLEVSLILKKKLRQDRPSGHMDPYDSLLWFSSTGSSKLGDFHTYMCFLMN